MKKLYFLRHGESQANLDNVYAGQFDSPLTNLGRAQARQAGKIAKDLGITRIITSNLSRAYDTAYIMADACKIDRSQVVRDKRLDEIGLGKLVGQPRKDHQEYMIYAHKGNEMEAEPLEDVVRRIRGFVADLDKYEDDNLLLVGHNGSGLILMSVLSGGNGDIADMAGVPQIPNCEIVELSGMEVTSG